MDPASVPGEMCTRLRGGVDHHRRRRWLRRQPPRPDIFLLLVKVSICSFSLLEEETAELLVQTND